MLSQRPRTTTNPQQHVLRPKKHYYSRRSGFGRHDAGHGTEPFIRGEHFLQERHSHCPAYYVSNQYRMTVAGSLFFLSNLLHSENVSAIVFGTQWVRRNQIHWPYTI